MTDKAKNPNRGLLYVILLCSIGLVILTYLLIVNMNEVRALNTHKEVLIRRLAEEVSAKGELQKELDSLKKIVEGQGIPPISRDMQVVKP